MSVRTGLQRLGSMQGKTEQDFVKAMGRKPVAIATYANGTRLLQWRSGNWMRQHIAVLFDANHRFSRVTSRYQV